ncbi:hypothetical protein GCM10007276_14980 [Agaricicola taiwanensis]|uniref:Cytochrome c oxidase subunit IV bacterial aa3 type domain-containing protein n=1 Tax=Agaricicola taiwanensis TaxID=591372 RepID=A0A8J2VVA7_9RHOB|nr:aa3-type cytochrome c oxidase subunit IV [Agaricicola taiwanensis]GGE38689.1 hypothetical protein GCM10007276_14980 [Agaricicola taiwanensis]
MAEHATPEYATAQGNDYPEHERTYENVIKLAKVSTLATLCVVAALAVGGIAGSMFWMLFGIFAALVGTGIGLASSDGKPAILGGLLVFLLLVLALVS